MSGAGMSDTLSVAPYCTMRQYTHHTHSPTNIAIYIYIYIYVLQHARYEQLQTGTCLNHCACFAMWLLYTEVVDIDGSLPLQRSRTLPPQWRMPCWMFIQRYCKKYGYVACVYWNGNRNCVYVSFQSLQNQELKGITGGFVCRSCYNLIGQIFRKKKDTTELLDALGDRFAEQPSAHNVLSRKDSCHVAKWKDDSLKQFRSSKYQAFFGTLYKSSTAARKALALFLTKAVRSEVIGNTTPDIQCSLDSIGGFSRKRFIEQSQMCAPLPTAACTGAFKTR